VEVTEELPPRLAAAQELRSVPLVHMPEMLGGSKSCDFLGKSEIVEVMSNSGVDVPSWIRSLVADLKVGSTIEASTIGLLRSGLLRSGLRFQGSGFFGGTGL
jgi:hypothetical protein